jgi:FKBP-type peptidyl-prolyl cis-trans isomerase (trigger factor)
MDNFHTRKDVDDNTVELTITIPADSFKKSYDLLLKEYSKDLDIKGFRKGNVPSDLVSDQVKEVVKYEAFDKLAPIYVNTAIAKEELEPIAPPQYKEAPKILENLDIPFTITITTMPKFKLGDMKKVKVKKEDIKVTDEEIQKAIDELKSSQKTEEKEINDKWATEIGKALGDEKVKTLQELKTKIENAIKIQKEHYQLHNLQDEAIKLGIKQSKIEIPQPAIDYEAQERERYFNEDMQKKGVNIDDFLKANNITIEKMRELWQMDAKEAIQTDVFLTLYADTKKIEVTDEELKEKVEQIKKERPDADSTVFDNPQWKEYIKKVERKEKAFRAFIEEVLGKDFLDEHN